jgi:hypothetical protein
MAILRDLASMLSATTGTGTLTLTTAASGFITFDNAGVAHGGVTVTYLIVDGTSREVGRGVYTFSGLTLTRATVLASTNGGSKISCSGTQTVSITDAAEDHIAVDEAQPTAFTAAQKGQLFSNIGGAIFGGLLTPPVLANFTKLNQGTSTMVQNTNANSITFYQDTVNSAEPVRGLYVAVPATPYRVQALVKPQPTGGYSRVGIGWSDAGTKTQFVGVDMNNGTPQIVTMSYAVLTGGSATMYGTVVPISVPDLIWLGVADDGTTIYFEYSYDGVNWVTQYSIARSSGYLGGSNYTNAGMFGSAYNGTTAGLHSGAVMLSWNTVASAP